MWQVDKIPAILEAGRNAVSEKKVEIINAVNNFKQTPPSPKSKTSKPA